MTERRYPLPWWLILDSPPLRTANGPIYRGVACLALAYWASGCVDFATDDVTIASLTRLPLPHIHAVKPAILAVVSAIAPRLKAAYDKADRAAAGRAHHARQLTARRMATRAQRQTSIQSAEPPLSQPARDDPRDKPTSAVVDAQKKSRAAGISSEVASYHD